MSVDRGITISFCAKKFLFSDFVRQFVIELWLKNENVHFSSLYSDSEDEDKTTDYLRLEELKPILDKRQQKGKLNCLSFYLEQTQESITLIPEIKDNNSVTNKIEVELLVGLGLGKRLKNTERYTDYSFYLEQIVHLFKQMDCNIYEIKCKDIG